MNILLTTLIISISLLTITTKTLSEKCNPKDKKVLLQIKQAFNNPYVLTSWNPENDCCDWCCVDCSPTTNRITKLTLSGGELPGELSGPIPAAVGDLPYLETLVLHKQPNLTGSIPVAITKLKNLKVLELSWTNLSGSVPGFLSNLPNLTFLNLSFNNLTGLIPSELANLKNLGEIYLDRNKLIGSIPDSFGKWAGKVPALFLSHNQLSGKIPLSLGNLNFGVIDFSRNKLEGDASMLFGVNKSTWRFDLSRNLFQFDLSKLEYSSGMTDFDINHNKIFGSLPASMTGWDLSFFNVSYNRLCGKIPIGGKLQGYDSSAYFHNRCLCGSPLSDC